MKYNHHHHTCSQEDVIGGRVPSQDSNPLTVSLQGHRGIGHRTCQAPVWDLPHLWTKTHSRCLFTNAFLVADVAALVYLLTFTVQSSEALAMMLSSWGDHWMSSTGAAWPQTVGQDWSILPLCKGWGGHITAVISVLNEFARHAARL